MTEFYFYPEDPQNLSKDFEINQGRRFAKALKEGAKIVDTEYLSASLCVMIRIKFHD